MQDSKAAWRPIQWAAMGRDRLVVQLSTELNIGYAAAFNMIQKEINRSGDKFSDAAHRLIAEAEKADPQ